MSAPRVCISCEIAAGRVREPGGTLYEDEYWHLGFALPPVVWRGFAILKLKRHCEQLAGLTPAESARLGPLLAAACGAVQQVTGAAKVYVCSFGDGVRHIHFWILPRPPHMPAGMHPVMLRLDLRLGLTRALKLKRWLVPPEQIEADAAQVRAGVCRLLQQNTAVHATMEEA